LRSAQSVLIMTNTPDAADFYTRYQNSHITPLINGHDSIKAMENAGVFLISFFKTALKEIRTEPEPINDIDIPIEAYAADIESEPDPDGDHLPWMCRSEKCYHYDSNRDECYYRLYFRKAARPEAISDIDCCPMVCI